MARVHENEDELVVALDLDEDGHARDNAGYTTPELQSSCLGRLFYTWATKLFVRARRKNKIGEELEDEDLFDLTYFDETDALLKKFDRRWQKYVDKWPNRLPPSKSAARGALFSSLFGVIRWRFLLAVVLRFLNSTVQFLNPLILNQFLLHIQQLFLSQQDFGALPNVTLGNSTTFNGLSFAEPPLYEGYLWATALILANLLNGLLETFYFWTIGRCGWQVRSTVFSAVFRKSLALSASGLQSISEGEIINYMQLDAQRLEGFVIQATSLWDGLYQIAGYIVVIYLLIGDNTFIGLAVMLSAIPVNLIMFGFIAVVYRRLAGYTDKRTKATNEVIQAVLGVKMAAWEENFSNRIKKFRAKELHQLKILLILVAVLIAVIFTLPTLGAVTAINSYAQDNGVIDAATLFAVVSGFASLTFPFFQYPAALQALANAVIGQRRLATFLSKDETQNDKRKVILDDDEDKGGGRGGPSVIEIVDGEFYWYNPESEATAQGKAVPLAVVDNQDEDIEGTVETGQVVPAETATKRMLPVLEDINIKINSGELVAIVGRVGTGKSSLLGSMLGETFQTQGFTTVKGSVAYSAQTAWIQNATLRDNVLFGLPFDEERYWAVMQACQFKKDLEMLQDGDQTIIGERGINLSGGQKQRVSVARAAYSQASILVLDDPMSALDPKVGKAVFEQCLLGFLHGTTRVMATNQLNLLPEFDKIIVLSNETGRKEPEEDATGTGTGTTLSTSGRIVESGTYGELMRSNGMLAALMNKYTQQGDKEKDMDAKQDKRENEEEQNMDAAKNAEEGKTLMQVEERAKGAVKLGEYIAYMKASGGILIAILVVIVSLAGQGAQLGNSFVITLWTDSVNLDGSYREGSLDFYSLLYFGTTGLVAIVALIRGMVYVCLTLNASRKLHENLINGILRAPMSFFDTTPTGRVLSRFTKDMAEIDGLIPRFLDFFFLSFLSFLFAVGTILYTVYFFAIILPFLTFIYYRIVQYYRPVARDAKRLEAISRSPVFAFFSEAISGLPTIRAYNKVAEFNRINTRKVNNNVRGFYITSVVQKWLQVRLRALAAVFTMASSIMILLAVTYLGLTPGLAGLGLTYMLQITGTLGGLVQTFTQLETSMNAVERINYYSKNIEREAPETSENPPPDNWPERGEIVIENLEMRYREGTPLVLRGINVRVEAGTRVGIVGRVGCGKSSLMLELLRIVEPAGGRIVIDGIDIATIGLRELRSRISIVPQKPTVFSGTVRSNLDPFGQHSDEELWGALDLTNMRKSVEKLEGTLDAETAEYGSNFSQGERQLLCMARSLLSKSQILLLDEATSQVDYETDALIQATIRESFAGCTILAIAHRVQTIIDSDRIMVMDAGLVAEYDTPLALLQDAGSQFRGVVDEMPEEMAANLMRLAEERNFI